MGSKRVFISHLDTAPARACAHVFRCFGWDIYGTVLDTDQSLPTPNFATEVFPTQSKDSEAFARGILSCTAVVFDLINPDETLAALELVATSPNRRKFITISTFLAWARTELPPREEEEQEPSVVEDDLPDEKEMELDEVVALYRAAHRKAPQWVQQKLKKRAEEERLAAEAEAAEEAAAAAAEEAEEAEDEFTYEEVEEEIEEEEEEEGREQQEEEGDEEGEDDGEGNGEDAEEPVEKPTKRRFRTIRRRVPKKKVIEEVEVDEPQGPAEELQEPDEQEPSESYEYEEEWSESEKEPSENSEEREERLLQLREYGIQEADAERRRPHPQYRRLLTAEKDIARRLASRENVEGAIVVPGLIYGFGETALVPLYRSIYEGLVDKIPLYYGGHNRAIPTVYALDLALLIHSLVIDACPDKEQPYVFAVERQVCTALEIAKAMGRKLLLPDPLHDKLRAERDEQLRTTKPKPLTKQTFREFCKIRDAPRPLPAYIREVDKEETMLGNIVPELAADSPLILGFASNDILSGKFPLFARSGFLDNIELSYSEFIAAWALKPVRIFIQKDPETSMDLADKVAMVLASYLSLDLRDEKRTSAAHMKDLADRIATERLTKDDVMRTTRIKIIDGTGYTLSTLQQLFRELAMDLRVRSHGWILIGLPAGMQPSDVFGRSAIVDKAKEYADVGWTDPAPKKKEDGEESQEEDAGDDEEDGEEQVEEEVEVDEADRIEKIRERILLPYTAPFHPFTRGRFGRKCLNEPPEDRTKYYDYNVSIEHPEGLRIPWPEYVVDLPCLLRYKASQDENEARAYIETFCPYCVEVNGEGARPRRLDPQERDEKDGDEKEDDEEVGDDGKKKRKRKLKPQPPTEHFHTLELSRLAAEEQAWHAAEQEAARLYRLREHARLKLIRYNWVKTVKRQCIKKINALAEKGEPGIVPYDKEYTWINDFNLVGLDPRLDLDLINIPKKQVAEQEEEPQEEGGNGEENRGEDEDEETLEKEKDLIPEIDPDAYDLGIEDEDKYRQMREAKAESKRIREEKKREKAARAEAGEEVSELEPSEEEPEFDETGRRIRTTPKPKPFKDAPPVPIRPEDIPLPEVHNRGFAWLIEMLTTDLPIPYGCTNIFSPSTSGTTYSSFETLCRAILCFVGPSRGFGLTRTERLQAEELKKREAMIRRQLLEEELLRKAEQHRIEEEQRVQALYDLREKLIQNEERRIHDLSIPIRKYLTQTVMGDLLDGLIEVGRLRPANPLQYLGRFLLDRSVPEIK
ncbi:Dpy-30 motif-containing protein [Giardia muris]|uniref:Dpy-30 motif-containing protein n=1 Tax=Giardia muris TaxID=5742 RepID=A0A4Z1SNS0_GIAMU|nr:Dpy-30 motif-containing protein [Giardia muris]|eukprot:TNJ27300.1 Dpy-30 motif-containing protein [Giardia muris]